MTTDPIAVARALIADAIDFACAANQHLAGQDPEQAQQWRDALATLADALEAERSKVAAAYEAAALFSESQRREGDSFYNDGWCACATVVAGGIRNITPSDAQAALDKLLAEARLEGWRAGRDAAACEAQSCTHDPYVVRAISALPEPKEAEHE